MQRFLLWVPVTIALVVVAVALIPEPAPPPIKVGVLHSLTGTMATSEKPVMEATLLAIAQINAHGGVLGRKVEAVVVDGKSDPAVFAREAERLITEAHVRALFGCWTSACRKTVKPIVERQHSILFYPVQYEGLEDSPNIIYTGATPNQQIIPAVSWAIKHLGKRIYLVGSDYIFPRVANWLIRRQVALLGGTIVGERYLPLGSSVVAPLIADIVQHQPALILNTINGDSNQSFFHALHEAGVTATQTPVLSFSVGEAELAAFHGDDEAAGHYAAWNYFQSIDSAENRAFVAAFRARFGRNRVLTDPMEAAWIGVQLWAKAVRAARTTEASVIRQTVAHQSIPAPEGVLAVDHATRHLWKMARIGRIGADRQFTVVWQSRAPIRPDPFPALVKRRQADALLQKLYADWGQHWSRQPEEPLP